VTDALAACPEAALRAAPGAPLVLVRIGSYKYGHTTQATGEERVWIP
jgi:hypothetical protein